MIGRVVARSGGFILDAGGREIELRGELQRYAGKLVRVTGRWSEEGLSPALEVDEAILLE